MNKLLAILKIVNTIPVAVASVENIVKSRGAGKEKAEIVREEVMSAVEASLLINGKDIKDMKKFKSGVKKITDGVVEVFNATIWS